jgi:hypothetical protein
MARASILVAFAVALAVPATARAQPEPTPEDKTRAIALFEAARKLTAKGEHSAACPLYEQSFQLVRGLGTQLNLGDCWARIGKLVAALATFRDLEASATAQGQTERARIARDYAQQIETRLPRVILIVPPGVGGRLSIDGAGVEGKTDAAGIPVDPGSHRALLVAADDRRAEQTWIAVEGKTETIRLEPPPAAVITSGSGVIVTDPSPVEPLIVDPTPPPRSRRRRLALWSGGVAVACGAVALGLAIEARRKKGEAIDEGCEIDGDHATCPDASSAGELETARMYVTGATVLGLSAVGFGVLGIILYATAPEPSQPFVRLAIDRRGGGIVLEKRW